MGNHNAKTLVDNREGEADDVPPMSNTPSSTPSSAPATEHKIPRNAARLFLQRGEKTALRALNAIATKSKAKTETPEGISIRQALEDIQRDMRVALSVLRAAVLEVVKFPVLPAHTEPEPDDRQVALSIVEAQFPSAHAEAKDALLSITSSVAQYLADSRARISALGGNASPEPAQAPSPATIEEPSADRVTGTEQPQRVQVSQGKTAIRREEPEAPKKKTPPLPAAAKKPAVDPAGGKPAKAARTSAEDAAFELVMDADDDGKDKGEGGNEVDKPAGDGEPDWSEIIGEPTAPVHRSQVGKKGQKKP